MSTSPDQEPAIIKEVRALYDYVKLMGDQVNQMYARIERLETKIRDLSERSRRDVSTNARELAHLREIMVKKEVVTDLFERLAASALPLPAIEERDE
jgi:DNA anti-recombination protein RmuC